MAKSGWLVWVFVISACQPASEPPDGMDAGLDASTPLPPYTCASDDDCGGDCIDGQCECTINAQCIGTFGSSDASCYLGRCQRGCPVLETPRVPRESFEPCDGPRENCCGPGERCCHLSFEQAHCLPGDAPCWPMCPDGQLACAPDQFCTGAELGSTFLPRCSRVDAVYTGVRSSVCLDACPEERRCGAQTCCAEGTVCVVGDAEGAVPADGDPGFPADRWWIAGPPGYCCVPD